jgi:hypothetical protein
MILTTFLTLGHLSRLRPMTITLVFDQHRDREPSPPCRAPNAPVKIDLIHLIIDLSCGYCHLGLPSRGALLRGPSADKHNIKDVSEATWRTAHTLVATHAQRRSLPFNLQWCARLFSCAGNDACWRFFEFLNEKARRYPVRPFPGPPQEEDC